MQREEIGKKLIPNEGEMETRVKMKDRENKE